MEGLGDMREQYERMKNESANHMGSYLVGGAGVITQPIRTNNVYRTAMQENEKGEYLRLT